jgi:hypothetical protein
MRRFLMALAVGILAVVSVQSAARAQTAANPKPKAPEAQYQVLNPWAEVDPIPLRGISPRVPNLAGKKIGVFANFKRAAKPIALSIEKRLRAMYPDATTSIYESRLPNVSEIETKNRDKFTAWLKEMDAFVAVVGD